MVEDCWPPVEIWYSLQWAIMTVAAGKVWNLSIVKIASLGFFSAGDDLITVSRCMETIKRSTPELHACVQGCTTTFGQPHFSGPAVIRCPRIGAKTQAGNFNFWLTPGTVSVTGERVKWVNWSFFYIVSDVRLRGGDEGHTCSLTCTHMHTYAGWG